MYKLAKYFTFLGLVLGLFVFANEVKAVTYQGLTVDRNPVVANAIEKQSATLTLNAANLSEISNAQIIVNYRGHSANPTRGRFQWNAARGFEEIGGVAFGNDYVNLVPQDGTNSPSGSQVSFVAGVANFTFRWTLSPQYGNMADNDISYYFTDNAGRNSGWRKVETNFEVTTNGLAPITFNALNTLPSVVADGVAVQTATLSLNLLDLNRLSSVQIINNYNSGTSSLPMRGRFQWSATRGFEEIGGATFGNDKVTLLTSGANASRYQIDGASGKITFYYKWTINPTKASLVGNTVSYNFTEVNGFNSGWVRAGNTYNIDGLVAPSLSFVKDTSFGNRTIVGGTVQEIGRYVIRAGSSEGVKLTNVVVKFGGLFNAPTMIQNLELYAGTTQLGATVSSVASTANSFTFELNLIPNESKVIVVKGYVTSNAAGTFNSIIDRFDFLGNVSGLGAYDITDVIGQSVVMVGSANVVISAVTDSQTISRIYTTSAAPVMLGKWKVEAQSFDSTLRKITFSLQDENRTDDTTSGNFGLLSLYDATNMATPLATANYLAGTGNGYVQFVGLNAGSGLTVPAGSYKNLVLKGVINESGFGLDSDSVNEFVITDDSNANMEIYTSFGSQLGVNEIDAVSGDNTPNSRFARGAFYKFHDAYPTISSVNVGSLGTGTITPVFKFTVKNEGVHSAVRPDVDLRIGSIITTIATTGLTSNGSATGTIGSWKLWEANSSGGLGTQIAVSSANGLAGGSGVVGYVNANTTNVVFNTANDVNGIMNDLRVAPGASRTFIVTADTTNMGAGKGSNSFTVNVSGKISGATGWSGTAWNTGNFEYFCTTALGSEVGPFTHSDSYDVLGDTVSRTF